MGLALQPTGQTANDLTIALSTIVVHPNQYFVFKVYVCHIVVPVGFEPTTTSQWANGLTVAPNCYIV